MIGPATRLERCLHHIALALGLGLATSTNSHAQTPLRHWTESIDSRFAASQPAISYTIRVDSTDLTSVHVVMTVRARPERHRDTTMLAMVTHPEYDDKYWRFVRDVRVEGAGGSASIIRADSSLWRVIAPGGSFTVRYRLALPEPTGRDREAWKPFLAPTGGLVGGTQTFMYVVGETLAPSHVALDIPASWSVATGLIPTSDVRTFYAPSTMVLVESPVLIGRLREWRFNVDGTPHRVVYWPLPNAIPFDTTALVSALERLARATIDVFGRAPYRDYTFLIQDGAYGALEHASSVTLGAPSRELAQGFGAFLGEAAHEYFHTWNLMRIRPAEYADVTYGTPTPSRGLWFSEGLSMFYSDLLRRRAGLAVGTPTRAEHLQAMITRYYGAPGNGRLSAERVSAAAYGAGPEALGDYGASTHLQGEAIGTMMDLEIRHATHGRRSMDDVMRLMLERYAGERGFTSRDVERTVAEVCGCNVTPFFDAHVRSGHPIPFDDYLKYIGLRADVAWRPSLGEDGRPVPDFRAYSYDAGDGRGPRLAVSNPESAWGRAGLHTGDRILAMNGQPTPTTDAVFAAIRRLKSGDSVRVDIERASARRSTTVVMTPFDRPFVELRDLPTVTAAQRELRARWESGVSPPGSSNQLPVPVTDHQFQ